MTKKKNKQPSKSILKRLNKKRVIQVVVISALVIIVAIGGIFAFHVYQDTEAFSSEKLLSSGASQVFDDQGNVIFTYGTDENGTRQNVTYDDLPQVLIDAVVAAEDSRYFEHNGFDLPRIAKAAISNLMAGSITGGGSTITQQVIKKSYFPDAQKTYTRKFSEIILAIKADSALSKEEIITLYLNKIYFGRSTSSIGIAAASKYYFNKDVSELTLPEAALLAGSLNSPYNYDPYYNIDKATARRNTILNLMVDHGYITQDECDLAKKVAIENTLVKTSTASDPVLAAYIDLVTKEVIEKTNKDPRSTQMNIYTYCNYDTQKVAADLNNGVTYDYSDDDMQMAGAVQSTLDGRVVAVLGGRNYQTADYNLSTYKQQPGSSVKPFLDYGLAFEYLDWCTGHTLKDEPYTNGSWSPKNWDGSFHGDVTVSDALVNSWNIPAIKTLEAVMADSNVSVSDITDAMTSIGINMTKEKDVNLAYAIGGWNQGISPIEMCSAYSTIANNGLYTESHTINYVEIVSTGEKVNIDEDIQKEATQSSYSAASAFMVRQTMLDYTATGAGSYSYLSEFSNIAGKTGTSNWGKNNYVKSGKSRDLWMSAYTPDYTCSVWMGFMKEGYQKGKNTSDYKATPAKVVRALMEQCEKIKTNKTFPDKPEDVVQAQIVKGVYPYVSPSANTPADRVITAWFKKGTTPSSTVSDLGINNLNSFEASVNASNKIAFNFTAYDPAQATTDDQTNDATKMYGVVVYTVVVTDASSQATLATQTFNTNSGTLDYTVNGQVTVTGYYSYANAPGITSNKISKTIGSAALSEVNATVTVDGASLSNGGSIASSSTINVNFTPQNSSNTCTVSVLNDTGASLNEKSGKSCTISGLSAGTYTLHLSETDGSKTVTKDIKFTVV